MSMDGSLTAKTNRQFYLNADALWGFKPTRFCGALLIR